MLTILLTETVLSKHSNHGADTHIPAFRLTCPHATNAALLGVGMGVQKSPIPAAVAPMVAPGRRASAYGLFTGIYGTAWVAGSIVIGVLVSVSVSGLVAFCMACELTAIPLIWMVRARSGPPARQPAG
jgi:MFS family permease